MIGQEAPPWRAKAYVNGEDVTLSSEENAGKWHVLHCYPLDFTFICPTDIAWRATVIIDDQTIVRSVAVNDVSAGRSPAEVLRTTQALMSGGLCGADWRKGEAFAA